MTNDYREALSHMENVLSHFETLVPAPSKLRVMEGIEFRYTEKTIEQAIIQKLAKIITSLKAAHVLLDLGFFQEQAIIQRVLDELDEDILFLLLAITNNEVSDLHKRYLSAFYEEELESSKDSVESKQKRVMIPRAKIRAYIAKLEANPSRSIEVSRTLSKTYSGFVHGASTHIMQLYGGNPPYFNVSGMIGTSLEESYRQDIWNYFYRGLLAFSHTAFVFKEASLGNILQEFSEVMYINAGKTFTYK